MEDQSTDVHFPKVFLDDKSLDLKTIDIYAENVFNFCKVLAKEHSVSNFREIWTSHLLI